jgi:malate dehydrogenase
MNMVAIIGAGATAAATARSLADLDVAGEIRLIDTAVSVAAGKALDIQQAGPIAPFHTRLAAMADLSAATGAAVVVVADRADADAEWRGDAGLEMVRRLVAVTPSTPLVFAGAGQYDLMLLAVRELHLDRRRLIGSAPEAFRSGARALVALAADVSQGEVSLSLFGTPAGWVFGWSEATVAGRPATEALPSHEILVTERRMRASWPPGPYALGSAAARVLHALLTRSRAHLNCFAALEGPWRRMVGAMLVRLDADGIAYCQEPALSARERVQLETTLAD